MADVDLKGLTALANRTDHPIFAWFYAPWCKQCKVVRPAVEAAAKRFSEPSGKPITFAKLDCVADLEGKKFFDVNSYPCFKVLRGHRQRWVEMGTKRTAEIILARAQKEARGPFEWVSTEDELKEKLWHQVPPKSDKFDVMGLGEALAIAVLSSADGAAAHAYTDIAAGCSQKLSQFPWVATTNASLVTAVGLKPIPVDHIAIVKLKEEIDASPSEDQGPGHLVSRPLLPPGADTLDLEQEKAMCTWSLAHRLPLLIDYDEDPYWGKRVGTVQFNKMHALLFLSPPWAHLAAVVRAAVSRFERGDIVIMKFMISGLQMQVDDKAPAAAMLKNYGVTTVLDTPRLVFLDLRYPVDKESRQRVYKGAMTEDAIADFIKGPLEGMPDAPLLKEVSKLKDEL